MNKQQANDCFEKAKYLGLNKEYERAIKLYEKASRMDSDLKGKCEEQIKILQKKKEEKIETGKLYHLESQEDFEKLIGTDTLCVVDFFATWCGPCKMIAPTFKKMAEENNKAIFAKIDVDNQKFRNIMMKYKISSMPTFGFFKNGKLLEKFSGANEMRLNELINTHS